MLDTSARESGSGNDESVTAAPRTSVPAGAFIAARAADSKTGEDTVVLSMSDSLGVTDAFVITSGRNVRQVRTIVDEVERLIKVETGVSPVRVEGRDDFGWVLIDYVDFIVHVFLDDRRSYYDLERLWGSAPKIDWRAGSRVESATSGVS
jgi:ribosome-associated protein